MFIWIAVVVVFGALAWFFIAGGRPVIYRSVPLSDLRPFVASLPAQMAPGGFLIAEREAGPGFLQLALRDYGHMQCTLEFGLPEVDWSAQRFANVLESLRAGKFEPAVEQGRGAVSRFLRVVIAGPEAHVVVRAHDLLALVARELGWDAGSTFRVRFSGSIVPGRSLGRLRARGA